MDVRFWVSHVRAGNAVFVAGYLAHDGQQIMSRVSSRRKERERSVVLGIRAKMGWDQGKVINMV